MLCVNRGSISLLLLALSLVACSKGGDDNSGGNQSNTGNIHIASNVPDAQKQDFVSALSYLDQNSLPDATPELLSYMGISAFEGGVVHAWLEERIQYIVPQNQNLDGSFFTLLQDNYTGFAYPGILPPQIAGSPEKPLFELMSRPRELAGTASDSGKIVMANIGTLYYLLAKQQRKLLGVKADGLPVIPLSSPRAGILIIGEGLDMIPDRFPISQDVFRLTTLIHESHHSDGHAEHAGFMHDKCVSGEFSGKAACDHNLNGPYEIETMVTKAYLDRCEGTCAQDEKTVLRILYLDSASRRIDDSTTTVWDSAPEGSRQ